MERSPVVALVSVGAAVLSDEVKARLQDLRVKFSKPVVVEVKAA